MKRHFIVMAVAAVFSIASLALIFGLWWLVSLILNDFFPHLVNSPLEAELSVLAIMLIMIAFLGAWLTSLIPLKGTMRLPKPPHTRPHPHLRLHMRH